MQVSIIVSLYRTEKHLQHFLSDAYKLIDELEKHDISHELILVSNDASTKEASVLKSLKAPFKVIFVEREPIYASWNRGIRMASGDFVTFWGVDDTRFPSGIIDGLMKVNETGTDIAYLPFRYHRFVRLFGLSILAKIKTFTPPIFEMSKFTTEMHIGPHFIVKRSLFDKIGFFDESFKIAGDFEFQVRAARGNVKFARVLSTSGIFRNDGTTLSGSRALLHKEENARAIGR